MTPTIEWIISFIWTFVIPLMLLGLGLVLHAKSKGRLIKNMFYGVRVLWRTRSQKSKNGLSPFAAFCLALSSTVGIGNIMGVFTAIQLGGPGAMFWMWILAFVSLPLKYGETFLATYFAKKQHHDHISGPLLYIRALPKGQLFARAFAISTIISLIFGIGTIPQVHTVVDVFIMRFDTPLVLSALTFTLIIAYITFGGLKSVTRIAVIVMPLMVLVFVIGSFVALIPYKHVLVSTLGLIISSAFNPSAIAGAGMGYTLRAAIENGIKRGIFSNESGLGSASFAASLVKVVPPKDQGYVHMLEVVVDTLIINTLSGLWFIVSGVYKLNGDYISLIQAGQGGLSFVGTIVMITSLIFFASTTIVAWSYYGSVCANYLMGKTGVYAYRVLFVTIIALSAFVSTEVIWNLSDLTLLLMLVPNTYAIWYFRDLVIKSLKKN